MTEPYQQTTGRADFFRTLFDQSPHAMQIFGPDGVVVKTNAACDALWGTERSSAVDQYNIFKDKQAQKIGLTSAFKQALGGMSTSLRDVEYAPFFPGGSCEKRFLHVRMLPLEEAGGQVEGIVCVLEDNTRQRQAELERLISLEQLEEKILVRTKHLEALLQFSTELAALDDLEAVYRFVISWAKSLLKFENSTLFILSDDSGKLTLEETIGFPTSMKGSFTLLEDQGLPSLVARTGKFAVVEDFQTEDRFVIPKIIFAQKLRSSLAVPILTKNKLIGVLIGHTRNSRIFSDSEVSLYQNIANQAGVAIVNIMNRCSLQRSEERFRHLFESANDAIYLVDAGTRLIVDCNQKALNLDGFSLGEMRAMKMYELHPPEEHRQMDERREQVLRTGSYTTVSTLHHRRKDNTLLPVEISSSLVETGEQKLIMNIVRDVSRRKVLEQEREAAAAKLRRSSRMEAIGLMAGGVAHDLNNILSGVVSYPELVMMKLPQDSPVRANLQKVMESGQRAAGVVADLLTVARGASTVKEVVSFNELLKEYMKSPEFFKLASLHEEVQFSCRPTDGIRHILCSPVHMQKVLLNLITNAAESITGAGRVEVSTSMEKIDQQENSQGPSAGEYVVLQVLDTGTGISRHDLDHIFDPFYTTKKMGRSGTGLGLAVVWNTVQDHDGHIVVNSGESGTVFTLYLPVTSQADAVVMEKKELLDGLQGSGKVLVVDDETNQREIAAQILDALGYESTAVGSGEEAVRLLAQGPVDLVLLDMLMDPGMNGRQTYERIIELHPGQRALVVSGYSESEDIDRVIALGVRGLLKKPYTIEEMGRAVQNALN